MVELTPQTQALVDRLFAPGERSQVAETLRLRCGDALPCIGPITPTNTNMERVRYGALKLSGGDVAKLERVVAMDWRDILVFAGFGNSLIAHKAWAEELLQQPQRNDKPLS